jgi:hypothetical protein
MSESCCTTIPSTNTGPVAAGSCRACGQRGKSVPRVTLQSLLLVDLRELLASDYRFCSTTDCPIAYFATDGSQEFRVAQVRVPIWQKSPAPTTLVCYCFKFTSAMLDADTQGADGSMIIAQIQAGIKDGLCACEITNPQGSCCLGNVHKEVARWRKM